MSRTRICWKLIAQEGKKTTSISHSSLSMFAFWRHFHPLSMSCSELGKQNVCIFIVFQTSLQVLGSLESIIWPCLGLPAPARPSLARIDKIGAGRVGGIRPGPTIPCPDPWADHPKRSPWWFGLEGDSPKLSWGAFGKRPRILGGFVDRFFWWSGNPVIFGWSIFDSFWDCVLKSLTREFERFWMVFRSIWGHKSWLRGFFYKLKSGLFGDWLFEIPKAADGKFSDDV